MRGANAKSLPIRAAAATASSNRAILAMSNSGDLRGARFLFDDMPDRDVISWNSMMSAYARQGMHEEVLRVFKQMLQRGAVEPTHTTLATVFASCAELRALPQGRQLHGLAVKRNSSSNAFVGTSLVTMYSKCLVSDCSLLRAFEETYWKSTACWNALLSALIRNQRFLQARQFFDRMPARNVISWTAMIDGLVQAGSLSEALELFHSAPVRNSVTCAVMLRGLVSGGHFRDALRLFNNVMVEKNQREQSSSRAAVIVEVVAACLGLEDADCGRAVHGHIVKLGFDADPDVEASLISMYFGCSEMEAAELEVPKFGRSRSTGACNSLIRGYVDNCRIDEARKVFDGMEERDEITWHLIIQGYLRSSLIDRAVELFSTMTSPTVEICTVLVSALVEDGRIADARKLFDDMPERDVILYTTLVSGYMTKGLLEEALELFKMIPAPSVVTYNVVLSGLILHGKLREAYSLFNEAPLKDEVSWSTMTSGLVRGGLAGEAFLLFRSMMISSAKGIIRPNEPAIASILSASASLSALAPGEAIHGFAVKLGYDSRSLTANSLINMYSKCGEVPAARSVFDRAQNRDLISWNSMLYGYAVNGCGAECVDLFEKMNCVGTEPDDVTFLAILCACTHGRLLGEARHYLDVMRSEHGIAPRLPHYSCLIELLCRSGHLEEAEELIHSMPFDPDSVVWSSLLSGSAMSGRVDLAEYAAERLLSIDPRDPAPYLCLARIYAVAGQPASLRRLRKKMNAARIVTRPGRSWIEINGEIFSFFAGDKSLPPSGRVLAYLEGLISRIKELGYVPDYKLVMEEMEEQEKEEVLMKHSEKIAVAFGLLRTDPPKPVRVTKNLRICGDCHSAMKLISLCTEREIVIRDNIRFHHFSGGLCSCSDSW